MKKSLTVPALTINILLVVSLFADCKKSTNSDIIETLSPDQMAYIQFNTGKYFIYRDSVANKTDSIVVTQSSFTPYTWSVYGVGYSTQQYTIVLTQFNGTSGSVWLSGTTWGPSYSRVQLISNTNSYNYLFQDVTTILPTMVVEGKTYTNVNVTSNILGSGFGANAIVSYYYWAKGIGLIKRKETVGSVTNTYTLLRSN